MGPATRPPIRTNGGGWGEDHTPRPASYIHTGRAWERTLDRREGLHRYLPRTLLAVTLAASGGCGEQRAESALRPEGTLFGPTPGADIPAEAPGSQPRRQATRGDPAALWSESELREADAGQYLTQTARDVVLHLNLARLNPPGYARTFLAPRRGLFRDRLFVDPLDPNQTTLQTREGPSAVDEAAREMEAISPMPTLSVSTALSRAARDHTLDQSSSGALGHEGKEGSSPTERVQRYGRWERVVGEVIAYGPVSGREVVSRLLIDDGVPDRGHRHNILAPAFRYVGVSLEAHPLYRHLVVIDLAADIVDEDNR